MPLTPLPRVDHEVPFHFAMQLTGMPPAVVSTPPAYRSLPWVVRALTPIPATPSPRGDHEVPSQRARRLVPLTPPAWVNTPPAYTSEVTSLAASAKMPRSIPLPRADHEVPSHLAMWLKVIAQLLPGRGSHGI